MLFYLRSDDNRIVEIETLSESKVTMIAPKLLHSPMSITYILDCGKVTNIMDTIGNTYEDCLIVDSDTAEELVLCVDEYFHGELKVKKYQMATITSDMPVANTYSGTRYTYFDGGLISGKFNYSDGKLCTSYYYRNDAYNTLEGARIYTNTQNISKIDAEYTYDDRETLLEQRWFDSEERLYYCSGGFIAEESDMSVPSNESASLNEPSKISKTSKVSKM